MGASCSCGEQHADIAAPPSDILVAASADPDSPHCVDQPLVPDTKPEPEEAKEAEKERAQDSRLSWGTTTMGHSDLNLEEIEDSGLHSDELVIEAIEKAQLFMKEFELVEAEEVLAKALHILEEVRGQPEDLLAAKELRTSNIFAMVSERVGQYDAACALLLNEDMQTLWETDTGRFELHQGPKWFTYRLSIEIDAPLTHCLSTGHEQDLVPEVQTVVASKPLVIEKLCPWLYVTLTPLRVIMFRVELIFEFLRVRSRRQGFMVESITSEFPSNDLPIPEKENSWRVLRPWVYTSNLWMPRGGDKPGTILIQVTRVDYGFTAPSFVLNWIFRNMAATMMADARRSAARTSEPGNPWARRIAEDQEGFYQELEKVDMVGSAKPIWESQKLPSKEFFNRKWRLHPKLADTAPPSSKK